MQVASEELLKTHYGDLATKPFFPSLVEYMKSGPVVPMVWEGKNIPSPSLPSDSKREGFAAVHSSHVASDGARLTVSRVSGFGFRVSGLGVVVFDGARLLVSGFRLGFRVWGIRYGVSRWSLHSMVRDTLTGGRENEFTPAIGKGGCLSIYSAHPSERHSISGFRVEGLGFRV
jgi:hypothetical protein